MPKVLIFLILYATSSTTIADSKKDIDCIAKTIYSEARGEPKIGQVAVGYTILNRTKIFNKPICRVIKKAYTQKVIPEKDKKEFYQLSKNIINRYEKNPIGKRDSFDSYKRYKYHKNPTSTRIGKHYFYQVL